MIKGCTKRVVVVKDVQSDIFEEAYFIMRPKSEKSRSSARENDIITEANRLVLGKPDANDIIGAAFGKKERGIRRLRDLLFFAAGAAAGVGGFAAFFI